MNIPEYARRLIVKHDSDWHSTRDDTRWSSVFKVRDESPVVKMANGGFLEVTRWMDKVPPFASQWSVWHFHPLEFMEILRSTEFPKTPVNGELTPIEFINFYNGDKIDDTDYEEAAKELGCEVAAIKAVATTAPIWLQSLLPDVSAHNVYYVKYAGFVVKFMRTSLSGTYRRISRLLKFSCGFTITS